MRVLVLLCCLFLTACSSRDNVAVLYQGKTAMSGRVTPTLTGGYFSITNGRMTCTGAFNVQQDSDLVTTPVICTDGRKGSATLRRQLNGYDGYGKLIFTDGEEYDVVYGRLSKPFLAKQCPGA